MFWDSASHGSKFDMEACSTRLELVWSVSYRTHRPASAADAGGGGALEKAARREAGRAGAGPQRQARLPWAAGL